MLQLEKELIYDGRKRDVMRKDFNRLIKDIGFISNNIDNLVNSEFKENFSEKRIKIISSSKSNLILINKSCKSYNVKELTKKVVDEYIICDIFDTPVYYNEIMSTILSSFI